MPDAKIATLTARNYKGEVFFHLSLETKMLFEILIAAWTLQFLAIAVSLLAIPVLLYLWYRCARMIVIHSYKQWTGEMELMYHVRSRLWNESESVSDWLVKNFHAEVALMRELWVM